MTAIDTSIKTYTTTTGDTYQVDTGQIDAATRVATLARLDELAATGKLDDDSLVSTLAPFPKSYTLVGGTGAQVPTPDEEKDYDRPPFGDITADMNAVLLLTMQTNQKMEMSFRKNELVERKNILTNAEKQRDEEKDAADHRKTSAIASSSIDMAGAVVGGLGSAKGVSKSVSAMKSSKNQSSDSKQLNSLNQEKTAATSNFDRRRSSLNESDETARSTHSEETARINNDHTKSAPEKAAARAESDARYERTTHDNRQQRRSVDEEQAEYTADKDAEIATVQLKVNDGHSQTENFNTSSRNWSGISQAASALFSGVAKAAGSTDAANAEYKDADAKLTGVQTQLMTSKQESLKSGGDALAGASASAMGTCNAIEQSRAEYSKSVASSLRA